MATRSETPGAHNDSNSTIRLVISGVLVLLLVVFVLQNLEKVQIDFLFFSIETSMLVAMLICAALGAAAALFFTRRGSKA